MDGSDVSGVPSLSAGATAIATLFEPPAGAALAVALVNAAYVENCLSSVSGFLGALALASTARNRTLEIVCAAEAYGLKFDPRLESLSAERMDALKASSRILPLPHLHTSRDFVEIAFEIGQSVCASWTVHPTARQEQLEDAIERMGVGLVHLRRTSPKGFGVLTLGPPKQRPLSDHVEGAVELWRFDLEVVERVWPRLGALPATYALTALDSAGSPTHA